MPFDLNKESNNIADMPQPAGRHIRNSDFRSNQNVVMHYDGFPEDEPTVSPLFNFWNIIRILLTWWWLIIGLTTIALVTAFVMVQRETPLYRATTTIEIKQSESNILDVSEVEQITANSEYMATQYSLLRSDALARRVVEELNLASDEQFANQSLQRDQRVAQASSKIRNNISVSPIGRSRLISIGYVSADPRSAARIPDAIADSFIAYNLERRYNATAYARDFLEERLQATKEALESSERELVQYAEAQGIININSSSSDGSSAGEASGSLDSASLQSLNARLTDARSQRIDAEQRYRQAIRSEFVPDVAENEAINSLENSKRELQAEYDNKLAYLKPEFPEMVQLSSRIATLDRRIEEEKGKVIGLLKARYEASLATETSLAQRIDELKESFIGVQNRSIEYNILKREVDTNRSQYEALLQRLKEISISDGIGTNLVSIVDRAEVPKYPFSPDLKRSLIMALVLGAFAGFGIAFAIETIDDRIKTPDDIRNKLGLPILGVIPLADTSKEFSASLNDSQSTISEAYASTRTSLQFSNHGAMPRCLHVTSTRSKEGKSSSVLALARSFASMGFSTLIIDADMRLPAFSVPRKLENIGLSGLLQNGEAPEPYILKTKADSLSLLPAGSPPRNPSELLSGSRFNMLLSHLKEQFDVIIIDGPPVLGLADAPTLGAMCDATIIVVEANGIRTPSIKQTIERLQASRARLPGIVLTKYKSLAHGYMDYYQYSYGRDANRYGEPAEKKPGFIATLSQKLSSQKKKRRPMDIV